ncbi:MAG: hypothetical protein PVJ76_12090, partial [Gemmatimonadota bacterium]
MATEPLAPDAGEAEPYAGSRRDALRRKSCTPFAYAGTEAGCRLPPTPEFAEPRPYAGSSTSHTRASTSQGMAESLLKRGMAAAASIAGGGGSGAWVCSV